MKLGQKLKDDDLVYSHKLYILVVKIFNSKLIKISYPIRNACVIENQPGSMILRCADWYYSDIATNGYRVDSVQEILEDD